MRIAKNSAIAILRTPSCLSTMNVRRERVLGSIGRECREHLLILGETHLQRTLRASVSYFNEQRLHRVADPSSRTADSE